MTDLFEDDEVEVISTEEVFADLEAEVEVEVETETTEANNLDARRRLEKLLEEKRLQNELDDSIDY